MIAALASRLVPLALDPVERWSAARGLDSFHWSTLSRPTVWVPLVVIGALGVTMMVIYRRHRLRRGLLAAFGRAASQVDLSVGERAMLVRIAEAADPRPVPDGPALSAAFEDGARQVLAGRTAERLSPEARRRVQDITASVRMKLGFADTEPSVPAEANLDRDDRVTVSRPGAQEEVAATVIGIGGVDVAVRLEEPFDLRVGGAAVLRKVRGGTQWEHNLTVTQVEDDVVRARLIGSPTRKNMRRFVRVPISRPVHVARYAFLHEADGPRLPTFVEGSLREIAGPGLLVEIGLQAEVGERVLVVLDLGDDRCLRGVGTVRRCAVGEDAQPGEVAIELTGMTEAEEARLVKETNAAARGAAQKTGAAAGARGR
ncbi:MAG: PilZ domain-containing protein [Phycisphaerae bacterium]